jgi:predicted aldo/keto reductase-like oxidoreductase
MQYRHFGKIDFKPSLLGFGTMRLPILNGDNKQINEPEAIRMIRHAIDQGVNYVDTAHGYHGGQSEFVTGKALKDGYREKVMLATKNPTYLVKSADHWDELLDEQLNKLQVDHIDFYLQHTLDKDLWKVVKDNKLWERAEAAKKAGKINIMASASTMIMRFSKKSSTATTGTSAKYNSTTWTPNIKPV